MRIIAGTAKGRRLYTPAKSSRRIRPTADRSREALFSIIGQEVVGAAVLDLYAGTGALGLEALSRGAGSALFVDLHNEALGLIGKNIELCGFSERSRIIRRDVTKGLFFLEQTAPVTGFDLVFIDPPYGKELASKALADLASMTLLAKDGLVIAEEESGAEFAEAYQGLRLFDRRRYGDTGFWLFRPEE
ncbi:16S rRNA (guanine(966)-N(2))-methyltransferase RsmD [Thermodesulfobacteriota bacterium]